jgi:hypothetical protein
MLSKEEMRDCLEYIRKGLQPLFERVATLEGKVEILTTTSRPNTNGDGSLNEGAKQSGVKKGEKYGYETMYSS